MPSQTPLIGLLPGLRLSLLLGLGVIAVAPAVASEDPVVLEPLVVEGERGPLDSNAGRYRQRLPCIGDCESGAPEQRLVERVLDDIKRQMSAAQMVQKPRFYEARTIMAPSLHRLDDKRP